MPIMDDLIAEARSGPAGPAAPPPPPPDGPVEDSPAMRRIMNPVGESLDDSLKRGRTWDQTAYQLKQIGANPADYADKKQHFDLAERKRELAGTGLSFSQAWRGQFQPFGSVLTVPDAIAHPLDYASRELGRLGGKEQPVGGRVVGNNEYNEAVNRFKADKASPDDIDKIATYERHAQIRGEIAKGANFGEAFALAMGELGKLVAETAAGGAVAKGLIGGGATALRAAGVLSKAAPAAAAAGAVPAIPVGASLGSRAASLGAAAAVTPSMYVPMMQQTNMRAGREDANDWKGLPTAFGYAYANMLVLGRLGAGLTKTQPLVAHAMKGVFGVAELQTVDAAAGAADQFLSQAYQFHPDDQRFGSVGSWLRAYRAGDADKASEVLRDATVQMLTFSAFSAMHGRQGHATDLSQTYADTIGELRQKGATKSRAAAHICEPESRPSPQFLPMHHGAHRFRGFGCPRELSLSEHS